MSRERAGSKGRGNAPGRRPAKRTVRRRTAAARASAASRIQSGPAPAAPAADMAPAPVLHGRQRRFLRAQAHALKVALQLGNAGLTDNVVAETRQLLKDHELIKVRIPGTDREARDTVVATLVERTHSALVGQIGHVAILYKSRPGLARIVLPDPPAG